MALVTLDLTSRRKLADGYSFDGVGSYEQLDGTAHFMAPPDHPRNTVIADLTLAPRDSQGLVEFTADVRILTPTDPQRGNHRLLFDVPNRGNRVGMWMFNRAPRPARPSDPLDPGDGFLMRQGYTVVWCGWQHDVPEVDGLMRIRVPEAVNADGPMSGKILVKFQPNVPSQVQLLSDRLHRPYPTNNLNDPDAMLLVRDAAGTPPHIIPRGQWSFAKLEAGQVVPDASHVYLGSGFEPGKHYQVLYSTTGAPVIGLGLLTARDLVSFLRYNSTEEGNPCAGMMHYAHAFGASQSGRYLRQFLYLGLNEDEQERLVFDGVLAHIAGGKRGGDFNQRFGQPSSSARPSMSDLFPFTDTVQKDSETGQADSLLRRLTARDKVPKLFLTNSSAEYWRGDGSLIHTNVDGTQDVTPSEAVRIYHYAGTQHTPGILPLTDTNPLDGSRGQQPFNSVDYTLLLRASLVRLDRWVSAQETPPPSRYPRLLDGTAVRPEQTATRFSDIPGLQFPTYLSHINRLDFGPETASGIATTLPPSEGKAYPFFVSAVDQDGNELGSIRLPDIRVPLATYMGWNLRHAEMGASDQLMSLMGATVPFPATREERESCGDPRLSIEERYAAKEIYLQQVQQAAQVLVEEGYLLAADLDLVASLASQRYDLFVSKAKSLQTTGD